MLAAASKAGTIASRTVMWRIPAPGLAMRETSAPERAASKKVRQSLNRSRGFAEQGQEMRPEPEDREMEAQRNRDARNQGKRQGPARRHRVDLAVGGKGADEIAGFHVPSPLNFAASAANPRCRATRTAPLVIERRAAASPIDAPSTAMARTTLRCPAGRHSR